MSDSRPQPSNFEPVRTKADLETLDFEEIRRGYLDAERGDPEPGPNQGRAYWHGWRNAMRDMHELPWSEASAQLAHEVAPRGVYAPVRHRAAAVAAAKS